MCGFVSQPQSLQSRLSRVIAADCQICRALRSCVFESNLQFSKNLKQLFKAEFLFHIIICLKYTPIKKLSELACCWTPPPTLKQREINLLFFYTYTHTYLFDFSRPARAHTYFSSELFAFYVNKRSRAKTAKALILVNNANSQKHVIVTHNTVMPFILA